MEAIFLLIGELAALILAPIAAIIVDAFGLTVGASASALGAASGYSKTFRRVTRILSFTCLALIVLFLSALIIVNTFFFSQATGYVLDRLQTRAGIITECNRIDGSIVRGVIELRDCTIRRPQHAGSTFDLSVAEVSVDVHLLSVLGTAKLSEARVVGLSGWVRTQRGASPASAEPDEASERPRREFEIDHLSIADSALDLSGTNVDGDPFALPVSIERLEVEPLRSRHSIFDLLFRANARGTLAGAPFELSSQRTENGRRTQWRASKVPIAELGSVTGGALAWFRSGEVSVQVDDEWARSENTEIDMDWRLNFSGLEVGPPPGTGRIRRFISAPLTAYVNRFDGEFPLEFAMVLNEDQFKYSSSLAGSNFWPAMGGAINNALKVNGIDIESAEKTGNTVKEKMKSVLDRVRRPKSDEDE